MLSGCVGESRSHIGTETYSRKVIYATQDVSISKLKLDIFKMLPP